MGFFGTQTNAEENSGIAPVYTKLKTREDKSQEEEKRSREEIEAIEEKWKIVTSAKRGDTLGDDIKSRRQKDITEDQERSREITRKKSDLKKG